MINFSLGIDFGTSGARGIVIDRANKVLTKVDLKFANLKENNLALNWQIALFNLIEKIPLETRKKIGAIAINGTSSTVLLCDRIGNPLAEPIWYNDNRGLEVLDKLKKVAPPNHVVLSATSSLAKLFWWQEKPVYKDARYFLHQADWLAFLLDGKLGISDYHNALKLGYDPGNLCYPNWLDNLPIRDILPEVLAPGTAIKEIKPEIGDRFGLPKSCIVYTGTTDSIAAFLASGAKTPGEAVTSLGSTLVLKLLSRNRVDNAQYGIYSHKLGDLWLTGGASNTGGAVLAKFFTPEELIKYSDRIDTNTIGSLDYYPLLKPGERFPINDPNLKPKLAPRPQDPKEFLHGLLESMAKIEARGYQLLQDLGADRLTKVYTAGGGAKNQVWSKIRQRYLQVDVIESVNTSAAYGTALLAKQN
ncbi:MAG: FGGY-family carbohydrate kinase [Prochloraceae cyanobacterium]|nr:FGGY-family carbohydrate kinase [Prochloraceae cyanobacterium]